MSKKDNKLGYLSPDLLSEAAKTLSFESRFYQEIGKKENFRIIPIPTYESKYLTELEKQEIVVEAIEDRGSLIYQIILSSGDHIVIGIDPITHKVSDKLGVVPATEFEYHG